MEYIRRINLKTDCEDRRELIDFCLANDTKQYVAIGWSCVYSQGETFTDYKSFYYAVKEYALRNKRRLNHALNSIWYVQEGDILWTRDLEGIYWICRAIDKAIPFYDKGKDIGAVVPVKAYQFGLEVPGQIKASFNRKHGGIVEDIYDKSMINWSKYIYNSLSRKNTYSDISTIEGSIISNLPDFDLEELVISYLQIKENYYVLSNSIASKSTTVGIECELISREKQNYKKAVVQVKAIEGKINPEEYKIFADNGFYVYFYDGGRKPETSPNEKYIWISKSELEEFFYENKEILPDSITMWEKLFK